MIEVKTIQFWNELERDEETSSEAIIGDVVVVIDGIAFLCQRSGDYNNLACINVTNNDRGPKATILAMFKFCIYLLDEKGVEFVRVEGSTKRYNFLTKIFSPEEVLKDTAISSRNVFYCNLPKLRTNLINFINEGI